MRTIFINVLLKIIWTCSSLSNSGTELSGIDSANGLYLVDYGAKWSSLPNVELSHDLHFSAANNKCGLVLFSSFLITVEPLYKGHVGTIILVLNTEVSSIQRSFNTLLYYTETQNGVLITEVSTFRRFVIERFQCI